MFNERYISQEQKELFKKDETPLSLRQRYLSAIKNDVSGLAYDLDGTAIDPTNLQLDQESAQFLIDKRVLQIPMTGRGIGSTDEIIVNRFPIESMQNIIIGNYNGCLIRRYHLGHLGNLQTETLFEAKLEESERIFEIIASSSPWKDSLVTESNANGRNFLSKPREYGVSLIFESGKLPSGQDLGDYLRGEGYTEKDIQLVFTGRTYDVISPQGGKANGVNIIASSLSIDTNSIARVGDQGRPGLNDYGMLKHHFGFSVGERDISNPFGCHPVVDNNGTLLFGIEGFRQLVNDLKFNPERK